MIWATPGQLAQRGCRVLEGDRGTPAKEEAEMWSRPEQPTSTTILNGAFRKADRLDA